MKYYGWTTYQEWLGCVCLAKKFMTELKALLAQECGLPVEALTEASIQIVGPNLEVRCSRELANQLIDKCFEVARLAVKLNCESALLYWPGCGDEPDDIGADLANEIDDRV